MPKTNLKKQKLTTLFSLKHIYCLVAFLVALQLLITNLISTKSDPLINLIIQKNNLENENIYFKELISSQKSLISLEVRAFNAGFVYNKDIIFAQGSKIFAKRQSSP